MSQEIKPVDTTPQFTDFAARVVSAAFDYIATFAPEVASVSYDDDCRWCFMDGGGKPVVFPEFGPDGELLDVSPLQAAADVVDYPSTFTRC